MSASATAPLIYNAVPVFADIDPEYFIIDPESLEERITERTKAIIVVDIYGHPYDADKINEIAKKHNLIVIEDAAQAPGAMYKGKMAGTLGDMGVYSLNYHKHIHSGEGGIIVTNNDELADKLRLIRNHAEAVLPGKGYDDLTNMIGYNYRMTELEAAVAREQLRKLPGLLDSRLENVKYINEALKDLPFLQLPKVMDDCKHAYYVHGIKYDEEVAGVSRSKFVEAVKAELMEFELRETEGVKIGAGYVKPLYLLPIYQNKIAYGEDGFPFNQECYKDVDYSKGICPVCEDMHFSQMITHEFMVPSMTIDDMDDFINAINKVWENIDELK
jgi:dTDP-4-amino-4,6-dideoxygalactose transaminase